jgi:hypothetical protein
VSDSLNEARRNLERRFPAWRIWYVRQLHGEARWFAQQGMRLLEEQQAEELAGTVEQIETSRNARNAGPA